MVRDIYIGDNVALFENRSTYDTKGLIVGGSEDEIIKTVDAKNKILANKGDDKDKIIGGYKVTAINNIFYKNHKKIA